MAPVKRQTTTTPRVTRARKAANVSHTTAQRSEKTDDAISACKASSDTAENLTQRITRKAKRPATTAPLKDVNDSQDQIEKIDTARSRNTRSNLHTGGLNIAPRRRLKITSLAEPLHATRELENREDMQTNPQSVSGGRSTRSRTRKNQTEGSQIDIDSRNDRKSKLLKRDLSRSNKTPAAGEMERTSQSRPKRHKAVDIVDDVSKGTSGHSDPVRFTKSQASTVLLPMKEPAAKTQRPKASGGVRKTVTFQELSAENDKENQPLRRSKAKVDERKQEPNKTLGKHVRAKPTRSSRKQIDTLKPKAAKESTVGRSTTDALQQHEAVLRVLTPKKITQAAKSSSLIDNDVSDNEDELNGGKTPIRDLSVSPRRPQTVALAKALSPGKKLGVAPSFAPNLPERTPVFCDAVSGQVGTHTSPPRRQAASPFRNSMNISPKRGLCNGGTVVFPLQNSISETQAPNTSMPAAASRNVSAMLQSPKRPVALEPSFFSQSAVKASSSKSPFKSSLFGTPAKRLFSPVKQPRVLPTSTNVQSKFSTTQECEIELEVNELSASSHFRSSLSPLRVVRADLIDNEFDFDNSILQVRSPLKAQKLLNGVSSYSERNVLGAQKPSNVLSLTPSHTLPLQFSEPKISTRTNATQECSSENLDNERSSNDIQSSTVGTPQSDQPMVMNEFATVQEPSDDSSEDELAADQTPHQQQIRYPSISSTNTCSRLSISSVQNARAAGVAFTPLIAQVNTWLASSPPKSAARDLGSGSMKCSHGFSPLARYHIDGEVSIDRGPNTSRLPTTYSPAHPMATPRTATRERKSSSFRESLVPGRPLGMISSLETPIHNSQFEEYMEIRAIEEQAEVLPTPIVPSAIADDRAVRDIISTDADDCTDVAGDDTIVVIDEDTQNKPTRNADDLTTDLINFTHTSDTAMVDFKRLATEANFLASDDGCRDDYGSSIVNISQSKENDTLGAQVIAQVAKSGIPATEPELFGLVSDGGLHATNGELGRAPLHTKSPQLRPVEDCLDSPSMLVITQNESSPLTSSSPACLPGAQFYQETADSTPVLNPKISDRRIINTVVSKVPLKPEGSISPIKLPRKRSRSFGDSGGNLRKRISFEDLRKSRLNEDSYNGQSPLQHRVPCLAPDLHDISALPIGDMEGNKSNRSSLGDASVTSTPGQRSFSVDDFGDSTLDAIDLPSDLEDALEPSVDNANHSVSIQDCIPRVTIPQVAKLKTPLSIKMKTLRPTTPMTENTTRISSQNLSGCQTPKIIQPRTPLEPINRGILHGAVVFVDVHTSEGANASSIFIELLTQMGAKCIKEWRWNPRASLAVDSETTVSEQKVGITHVVFKDGSKRTIEKVRDAKGEVSCIGVAWVLDCERENKWLDESNYLVDSALLPQRGSKRRKSMQPRALLVANDGSVSANRAKRSVSAEMSELMKRELSRTPAQAQNPTTNLEDDMLDEQNEDIEQVTPTGYISYDPRTAMTPGTPYLVGQGKKLTQMSAPPKQQNRSLFDEEEEENSDTFIEGDHGIADAVKDARKFRMKNLGEMTKRRRTLGFKPAVGSPLGRA